MLRQLARLLAGTTLGLLAALPAARAGDQITLKYGQVFPESHYIWQQGGKVFADRVAELTEGQVRFDLFPGGQLGKDYVGLLRNGLADAVLLVPSVAADKLPLSSVAELPEPMSSPCEATQKYWSLVREGGLIWQDEYRPLGIHPLFVTVLPTFRTLTTRAPLDGVESLKNLKIRGVGAAMDKTVRALGAVPIQIASPELFDALSRGTVDGALWGYLSSPQFDLVETFRHGIEGPSLGSAVVTIAMSQKIWDGLTPEVQQKMDQAATEAQESLCRWTAEEDARVRQEMIDKHGYQPTILPEAETRKWQDTVSAVGDAWAAEMDRAGKPGSKVLQAYRTAGGDS